MRWRPGRRGHGHEITCRHAVRLVTDYLDGTLPADDRRRFEGHLAECEHCAEHFAQIRVTVALTGQLREDDLDPLAREDLMALYRRWRNDEPPCASQRAR